MAKGTVERRIENVFDDRGNYRPRWVDSKTLLGVPHDIPVAGFGTKTVNLLRLWASKSTEDFDLAAFPSVNAWLRRVEQTPGFVTMDWTPDSPAADHASFAAEA